MRNLIRSLSGDLAHAYIIEYGSGGTLNVTSEDVTAEVRRIFADDRGVLPIDFHYMERDEGSGYKVKDAVKFQERLAMSPYGEFKVGVINDAELMSEIVQNKLLKTIEEPEADTVIILICGNRDALLPTVRSRCVHVTADAEDTESGAETPSEAPWSMMFHEFRRYIDKEIKSKEDALVYLGALERIEREEMLKAVTSEGAVPEGDPTYRVRAVGEARADIMRGMGYKQALKKLFLEIKEA